MAISAEILFIPDFTHSEDYNMVLFHMKHFWKVKSIRLSYAIIVKQIKPQPQFMYLIINNVHFYDYR